jgi:hypothetical protein
VVSGKCATDPSKLGADPETKTNCLEIQFVKKIAYESSKDLKVLCTIMIFFRRVLLKEEANLLKERIKSYSHQDDFSRGFTTEAANRNFSKTISAGNLKQSMGVVVTALQAGGPVRQHGS